MMTTAIHHINCGSLQAPPNPKVICHCLLLGREVVQRYRRLDPRTWFRKRWGVGPRPTDEETFSSTRWRL